MMLFWQTVATAALVLVSTAWTAHAFSQQRIGAAAGAKTRYFISKLASTTTQQPTGPQPENYLSGMMERIQAGASYHNSATAAEERPTDAAEFAVASFVASPPVHLPEDSAAADVAVHNNIESDTNVVLGVQLLDVTGSHNDDDHHHHPTNDVLPTEAPDTVAAESVAAEETTTSAPPLPPVTRMAAAEVSEYAMMMDQNQKLRANKEPEPQPSSRGQSGSLWCAPATTQAMDPDLVPRYAPAASLIMNNKLSSSSSSRTKRTPRDDFRYGVSPASAAAYPSMTSSSDGDSYLLQPDEDPQQRNRNQEYSAPFVRPTEPLKAYFKVLEVS